MQSVRIKLILSTIYLFIITTYKLNLNNTIDMPNLTYNNPKIKAYYSRMRIKHQISILIIFFLLSQLSLAIVDRTYFNYLGLPITATFQQVEQAYKLKLSKLQSLENSDEKMRKLTLLDTAYKALFNEKQREKYERYGKDVFRNVKEITSINQYSGSDSRKGPTMNIKVPVSTQELYNGTTVKATYQTRQACKKCMGTGADSPKNIKQCTVCHGNGYSLVDGINRFGQPHKFQGICPHCQGTGKLVTKSCDICHGKKIVDVLKTIQIKVPAKFQQKQLRLKNYGQQQQLGAPSDFLVKIEEIPSKIWKRTGQNLVHVVEITFQQSVFGFSKTIYHLSGQQISIHRTQITTKQTKLNFPNKGFSQKGRLTIEFKIKIPNFTDRQLDMWQDFFAKYNV